MKYLTPVAAFFKTAQVTIFCICIAAVKGSKAAITYIDKENERMRIELERVNARNKEINSQLEQYRKEMQNGQPGSPR